MIIKQLINIAALRHFRHITTQKKAFSFRGLCPLTPWTPLGAQPPDSRYRLVLCARHMGLYGRGIDPYGIGGTVVALPCGVTRHHIQCE